VAQTIRANGRVYSIADAHAAACCELADVEAEIRAAEDEVGYLYRLVQQLGAATSSAGRVEHARALSRLADCEAILRDLRPHAADLRKRIGELCAAEGAA